MDNEYLKTELLNTGGGCEVRIVHLDKKILIMNEDYVSLYNSIDDFWDEAGDKQVDGFWVNK